MGTGPTYDYVVFFDSNANRTLDAGEETFRRADFNYARHTASFSSGVPAAIFNSRGLPSTSSVSSGFVTGNILFESQVDNYSKSVVVSSSGRIRIL